MDPVSVGFYAAVCGVLGLAGPRLGAAPLRLAIGAGVGVVAVAVLPFFQDFLGATTGYQFTGP